MNLKEKLQTFFKGEILDDELVLKTYSHDASLFEIKPQLVVFPKDVEDLRSLVKFANQNPGVSLTARSGGTDMTGGPLNESIIVDFTKYFNRIKEVGDGYAITEPGVYYRDFEKETLKKNLLLPSFPASKDICTVGGMVANNAGGEKTLSYGKTEDYIQALKIVLSDGNEYVFGPLNKSELDQKMNQQNFEGEFYRKLWSLVIDNGDLIKNAKPRVSKNSAGYYLWNIWNESVFDLTKLFAGSQGTLGLVTEIKFRLVRPKPYSRLLVIFLRDFSLLGKVVNRVLRHKPESFDFYDDHTLRLGMRFLFWRFAFQFLPELWMVLTGGFPKLVLLAEFTGDSEAETYEKAQAVQTDLASLNLTTRITTSSADVQKYWTVRRESFNMLRKGIKDKQTAPFIDDLEVRPEYLPDFLPKLEELLKQYPNFIYSLVGHIGDGNIHIIPLMNLADEKSRQIIPELEKLVYDLVFQFGGSMTAEHNDGLIRTPFLRQMYGDKICELFGEVKNIFDPKNIFNPGKKVGATLDYSLGHIKKASS